MQPIVTLCCDDKMITMKKKKKNCFSVYQTKRCGNTYASVTHTRYKNVRILSLCIPRLYHMTFCSRRKCLFSLHFSSFRYSFDFHMWSTPIFNRFRNCWFSKVKKNKKINKQKNVLMTMDNGDYVVWNLEKCTWMRECVTLIDTQPSIIVRATSIKEHSKLQQCNFWCCSPCVNTSGSLKRNKTKEVYHFYKNSFISRGNVGNSFFLWTSHAQQNNIFYRHNKNSLFFFFKSF